MILESSTILALTLSWFTISGFDEIEPYYEELYEDILIIDSYE